MSVVLFRVDERLVHGQVVVGWGRRFHPRRMIVVDDELAGSPPEQEIYEMGVPEDVETSFWSERKAIERLPEVMEDPDPAFVLTEGLETMKRLFEAGIPIEEVNVGGLHAAPGREEIVPYVHLGPGDAERIRAMEEGGVVVVARDVPGADAVRLVTRLG